LYHFPVVAATDGEKNMEKEIGPLQRRGIGRAVRLVACLGIGVLALAAGVRARSQTGEKKESPFYCNIKVLSVTERAHKKQIGEKMAASQVETKELANGYAYRYRPGGVSLVELADWVESERRCCPFFDMALETEREGGPVWLKITGRESVKQFIRGEFKGLTVE
jgi:hypothetical protein